MTIIRFPVEPARESVSDAPSNISNSECKVLRLFPLPNSKKRLYGVEGVDHCVFFDTEEELIAWLEDPKTENEMPADAEPCTLDYVGSFAGYSDVLVVRYYEGGQDIYSSADKDGYCVFDLLNSAKQQIPTWEYNHDTSAIEDMYSALRDRGVKLTNDIYADVKRPKFIVLSNNNSSKKD